MAIAPTSTNAVPVVAAPVGDARPSDQAAANTQTSQTTDANAPAAVKQAQQAVPSAGGGSVASVQQLALEETLKTLLADLSQTLEQRTAILTALPADIREVAESILQGNSLMPDILADGMTAMVKAQKNMLEQFLDLSASLGEAADLMQQLPADQLKALATVFQVSGASHLAADPAFLQADAIVQPSEQAVLAVAAQPEGAAVVVADMPAADVPVMNNPVFRQLLSLVGQPQAWQQFVATEAGRQAVRQFAGMEEGQSLLRQFLPAATEFLDVSLEPEGVQAEVPTVSASEPEDFAHAMSGQEAEAPEPPVLPSQPGVRNQAQAVPSQTAELPPQPAEMVSAEQGSASMPKPGLGMAGARYWDAKAVPAGQLSELSEQVAGGNQEEITTDKGSLKNAFTALKPADVLQWSGQLAQGMLPSEEWQPVTRQQLQQLAAASHDRLTETEQTDLHRALDFFQDKAPRMLQQAATGYCAPELKQLWAALKLRQVMQWVDLPPETLQKAVDKLQELTESFQKAAVFPNEKTDGQSTLSFSMPLYFGDNPKAYPAYIHIFHQKENENRSAARTGETWLRVCLATENLGIVDTVFRLYNENLLNVRIAFTVPGAAAEFSGCVGELQNNMNGSDLHLVDVSVTTV